MSSKYQFDILFRRTLLLSKIYTKSWGDLEVLKTIRHYRENYMAKGAVMELVERQAPKMVIVKKWQKHNVVYMEGYFKSPLATYAPFLFPAANVTVASWRGLFPADESHRNGLVIHLASTGDHSYFRREWGMANDLLRDGISSILIENPFYGTRKPKDQFRSSLLNVADLFVMGAALVAECCFLLRWASQQGHTMLALSGVSMGGHMASLAATNAPMSVGLVPILSWTSAAPVFTIGALAGAINWPVLAGQLADGAFVSELQRRIPDQPWIDQLNEPNFLPTIAEPAQRLMWILMDEFTSLALCPRPRDTSLVRSIVAEEDAYVLRHEAIPDLAVLWPGADVHVVPGKGHVTTYFTDHAAFRHAIRTSLQLYAKRYPASNAASNVISLVHDDVNKQRLLREPPVFEATDGVKVER